MPHAQTERAHACDGLAETGPDAPTLCKGWTTHDLAAHLWIRENELVNSLGFTSARFKARTRARMAQLKRQLLYAELIGLLRAGPPRCSLYSLPRVDELANGVEYLVHGMDVRRANGLPEPERDLDFQDWVWPSVRRMARFALRAAPVGVVLERSDRPGQWVRTAAGDRIVTVVGLPAELLLYTFGRRAAADVELIGLDSSLAALGAA